MKIFHGSIVTCDWEGSVCSYLVEEDGKIIYTGDRLPDPYSNINETVEFIELGRRALLPAFGDGHIHFSMWALFNSTFDVRSAASLAEIAEIIKNYADSDPGAKIIFGFGHSEHSLQEKRLITRAELDRAVKDRPVALVCYEGHSAVLNTRAIGLLPDRVRSRRGFDLEKGHVFSDAFQEGANYITAKLPASRIFSSLLEGIDTLAGYGVGLIHTTEGVGYRRDLDVDMVRFIARSSPVQIRTYFQTMDLGKVLRRNLPRVGGCFACALDGTFSTKDAALVRPYTDNEQNFGTLYYRDEEVTGFVSAANRAGLQVQLHCAGDAAVNQAVTAIATALKEYPRPDHRHTLIHAPLIPERTLEQIAELGIGITIQPGFMVSPLEPPAYLETLLGERIRYIWPLKRLLSMGINVSGGSDGPVNRPDPLTGIYGACNHYFPEYSASISDALSMYTYHIAHTSFDEKERGSLEEGKAADLVVLNRNPLELEPKVLDQLRVENIYLAGEAYSGGKSIPRAIIEGLKNRHGPA